MADGIRIEIIAPERLLLSTTASSVTLPGAEGYFTVLGEHAPLITSLRPGYITVTIDGKAELFFVGSGFVEVNDKGVTVLAEQAMPIGEFGRSHVDSALKQARAAMNAASTDEHRSEAEQIVMSLENFINEMTTFDPSGPAR